MKQPVVYVTFFIVIKTSCNQSTYYSKHFVKSDLDESLKLIEEDLECSSTNMESIGNKINICLS